MNRTWPVVFAVFAAAPLTGCNQSGLAEVEAQLAKAQAELAATKDELDKAQAEVAKVKADSKAALLEREIDFKLPEVEAAQPLVQTAELVINITQDGKYDVQGKEFSEEQLMALLGRARQKNPNQAVLIRGDASLELRCAAKVMGMCNFAGIQRYSLATIE